jgi:hypothetical protein
MTVGVNAETTNKRLSFFRLAFGKNAGYICLAYAQPGKKGMHEEYFKYPEEMPEMLEAINRVQTICNVWFCPQLLSAKRRIKENVVLCPNAWADLDHCPPEKMLVEPSILMQSSPQRYQALWLFEDAQNPIVAKDISRRIAYFHAVDGCDKSGYDLTQLLRVPYTYNKKYAEELHVPVVQIISAKNALYRPDDFDSHYSPVNDVDYSSMPFPSEEDLPDTTPDAILEKYGNRLRPIVFQLHQVDDGTDHEEGRSGALWKLLLNLFEGGLELYEVFIVARTAACNKYAQDGKPDTYLWDDICRAHAKYEESINVILPRADRPGDLLSEEERIQVAQAGETFVDRYIKWASSVGDAATQYHQAGAFIALSAVMSGAVRLPTSFGVVVPNLWFMILADTTLTRKSTAMDMAMDMVTELDEDILLATDGSIEGLMTSISTRPAKSSVFLRDEFSGLLEQMTKKDYMSGMMEWFTKLYDGKNDKRALRKEVISIREPIFIMFVGGIKDRITTQLTIEHVMSGFLPRFIFITATSDPDRIKPLGPPTARTMGNRDEILDELRRMYDRFGGVTELKLKGVTQTVAKREDARLTDRAWARFNRFEDDMTKAALRTEQPDIMVPMFVRLGTSGLKAAVLMAAAEACEKGLEEIVVEERHLLRAIHHVQEWREYSIEILNNVGKGAHEASINRVLNYIGKNPGVTRARIMQQYHLMSREADNIFQTLDQRGLITMVRRGRGTAYWPVGPHLRPAK